MNTPNGATRRELLDRRLSGFHDVTVADVLEVLDYLRGPGDTVVAGGSLAFGLGNRLSDFDVVICGGATSPSLVPLQHWVKSLRVDVWTRSHADLDRLFRLAQEALERPTPIAGAFGSVEHEQQLKLLHRIAFGLDVAGPPIAPVSVPDFRKVARDLVVREYAERLRESVWVAQLAGRTGRWLAATVNAREAVEEALTIVLTTGAVPFTGDKWLHERLKSEAPQLRERYRRFAQLPTAAAECSGYVRDAVALATRLTGIPVDLDALGTQASWVGSGLHVSRTGTTQLLVAPAGGGVWELSETDLTAWAARSQPPPAGTEPVRAVWPGNGSVEADFCLGLYERGLVSLVWDCGVPVSDLTVEVVHA